MVLLLWVLQGRALEWAHCGVRPGVTVEEERAESLGGFNS
jgi:hypothetical protein